MASPQATNHAQPQQSHDRGRITALEEPVPHDRSGGEAQDQQDSGFVHGSTECHPLRCRGSGKGRIGGERVAAKYGVAGAPKDGECIAVLHSEIP